MVNETDLTEIIQKLTPVLQINTGFNYHDEPIQFYLDSVTETIEGNNTILWYEVVVGPRSGNLHFRSEDLKRLDAFSDMYHPNYDHRFEFGKLDGKRIYVNLIESSGKLRQQIVNRTINPAEVITKKIKSVDYNLGIIS